MAANIVTAAPHTHTHKHTPWVSKDQNSTFSEHVHIAYQIKGTHVYSNKLANIFPTEPPPTVPGGRYVKINFFRKWSCCVSNLREARMQQHGSKYFACRTPPPPPTTLGLG